MSKEIIAKGNLINSKKGITVEVSTKKGIGKGAEKEFVVILFSDKPSQKVLDSLKLKNFHYYKVDKTWSAYKTAYSEKFALSLIEEDKKSDNQDNKKPSTSNKGKKSSADDALAQILAKLDSMDKRLTNLEKKVGKK